MQVPLLRLHCIPLSMLGDVLSSVSTARTKIRVHLRLPPKKITPQNRAISVNRASSLGSSWANRATFCAGNNPITSKPFFDKIQLGLQT